LSDRRRRLGAEVACRGVRCPVCANVDDKVVDSRLADDGGAIRRRRECLGCGRRFTTYERIEEAAVVVLKRSGGREPFDRAKIIAGIQAAAKNRPVSLEQAEAVGAEVEEIVRLEGPEVGSVVIGRAVLDRLRELDDVTYLRFVSVYKGFADLTDFEREVVLLSRPHGDADASAAKRGTTTDDGDGPASGAT